MCLMDRKMSIHAKERMVNPDRNVSQKMIEAAIYCGSRFQTIGEDGFLGIKCVIDEESYIKYPGMLNKDWQDVTVVLSLDGRIVKTTY